LDSVFNEPIATPLTLTFQNCALFCEIQMAEVLAASDRENGKKNVSLLQMKSNSKNLCMKKMLKIPKRAPCQL
jgi:hypothetical protein